MHSVSLGWYKAKQAQLFLVKGILKTAKFKSFEEFVKLDNFKTEIEISLDEFKRHMKGGASV